MPAYMSAKKEHQRRRALRNESSHVHERTTLLTPRNITLGIAGGILEILATSCATQTPPQQYAIDLPGYIIDQFQQSFAVPSQYTDAINLAKCPPRVDISNAQLATATVSYDPGSGQITLHLDPREGVEGMVSVTATIQAVDSSGSCTVAGIASGSAEVDTKPTDCTQIGFTGNSPLLSCNGDGGVTVEGITTQIINGQVSPQVNDASHRAHAVVNDGHGNISELDIAIGANPFVQTGLIYDSSIAQYEVGVGCDAPSTLSSDLPGTASVPCEVGQVVEVPVRGGDNQTTTISALSNNFTTHTTYTAPVDIAPQTMFAGVYIANGKLVLDEFQFTQVANNAPGVINGQAINPNTPNDITVANAVVGPGGQTMSVEVHDPAGRVNTVTFVQPAYNPFEAIQAFFNGLSNKVLHLRVSSVNDGTQSIQDIQIDGHQEAPFTQGNWLHKLMETFTDGAFTCKVEPVAQQTWDATCDLPHGSVLGNEGIIDRLTLTATDANGYAIPQPLDVYSLTATQNVPAPLPRPENPSLAELAVNATGIGGAMIAGLIGTLGVAGIIKMIGKNIKEQYQYKNLDEILNLLLVSPDDAGFNASSGKRAAHSARISELVEAVPAWAREYVSELWRRKQDIILLAQKPRVIKAVRPSANGRSLFDTKTLLTVIQQHRKKEKAEKEFNDRVELLPQDKSVIKKIMDRIHVEEQTMLRATWLRGLDAYIGSTVSVVNNAIHVKKSAIDSELPELAFEILNGSDKSWIWRLIDLDQRYGSHGDPFYNLGKDKFVSLICAKLVQTNFNNDYFRVKEVVRNGLHLSVKNSTRLQDIEFISSKFFVDAD